MTTSISSISVHPALVDSLHQDRASARVQVAGIVGFAILTVLGAQVRIYLWEVPFTLQTVAVYGSGLYLGWRNGAAAQVLYLLLGLVFPVYAGDGYGAQYLFSAVSAGYLFGFPVCCRDRRHGIATLEIAFGSHRLNDLRIGGDVLDRCAVAPLCGRSFDVVRVHRQGMAAVHSC